MSVDIFNWREWPPLQHILLVRSMSDEKRGINWEGKIGEHIQEDGPGCAHMVKSFIEEICRDESGELCSDLPDYSPAEGLDLFIRFFWSLYDASVRGSATANALQIVTKFRKDKGFDTTPTLGLVERFYGSDLSSSTAVSSEARTGKSGGSRTREARVQGSVPKKKSTKKPEGKQRQKGSKSGKKQGGAADVKRKRKDHVGMEVEGEDDNIKSTQDALVPTIQPATTIETSDSQRGETRHKRRKTLPGARSESPVADFENAVHSALSSSRPTSNQESLHIPPIYHEDAAGDIVGNESWPSPDYGAGPSVYNESLGQTGEQLSGPGVTGFAKGFESRKAGKKRRLSQPQSVDVLEEPHVEANHSLQVSPTNAVPDGMLPHQEIDVFKAEPTEVPMVCFPMEVDGSAAGLLEATHLLDGIQAIRKSPSADSIVIAKYDPEVNQVTTSSPGPRPPLTVIPPIWAQSRQELCESCDFFKSYQGGVYFTKGFAKGYLLGGFPALRDVFHQNGKLIISHGGGKASSKLVEAEDQSHVDHSVSALLNSHRTKQPVVLIADDKYAKFPFDISRSGKEGYTYVVLGHYLIRDYWAESQPADNTDGFAIRYRFAFQWCGAEEPWWASEVTPSCEPKSAMQVDYPLDAKGKCAFCSSEFRTVYRQGWMCLNPSCLSFFTLPNGPATRSMLDYDERFLEWKPFTDVVLPDLSPAQPGRAAENGINTTPLFYRGWHCPCGRLSSRVKWEFWQCPSCEAKLQVTGKIRSHKDFWGGAKVADFEHFLVVSSSGILSLGLKTRDRIGCFTFVLPNNWGKIHMIVATALINSEANQIFRDYQEAANEGKLPFRRFPLRSHQCRGTLLTNYFSQNCGAPYQYVGGADRTMPFSECPQCVIRARTLIEDRASLVLGEKPPFNELLNAAYMEKQSMAFHTDNEKGLGPVVSSLSMGSPAIMRFRSMHDKKVGLSLVLRHGDVVVMEGSGVQENYDHTVVPQGFRIAATARWIGNENSDEGAWRRR